MIKNLGKFTLFVIFACLSMNISIGNDYVHTLCKFKYDHTSDCLLCNRDDSYSYATFHRMPDMSETPKEKCAHI